MKLEQEKTVAEIGYTITRQTRVVGKIRKEVCIVRLITNNQTVYNSANEKLAHNRAQREIAGQIALMPKA